MRSPKWDSALRENRSCKGGISATYPSPVEEHSALARRRIHRMASGFNINVGVGFSEDPPILFRVRETIRNGETGGDG